MYPQFQNAEGTLSTLSYFDALLVLTKHKKQSHRFRYL